MHMAIAGHEQREASYAETKNSGSQSKKEPRRRSDRSEFVRLG